MSDDRWIAVNPIVFQGRGFVPQSDRAFVIMPFTTRWSKCVFETVKNTLNTAGMVCLRADEQLGHSILEDIWQGLCEAAVIVADVTSKNPNVFYELGIAHVLGRRVVLLTQEVADIPFDTRVYRHIVYNQSPRAKLNDKHMQNLARELKKTVDWILENEVLPSSGPVPTTFRLLESRRQPRRDF